MLPGGTGRGAGGEAVSGDAALVLAMAVTACICVYAVAALWLKSLLRRWWVRSSGCPACAYRDGGPCSCDRKCINPDCKGAR